METEAQQQIYSRQVSRLDEEIIILKEKLGEYTSIQKNLRTELKEAERHCVDLETKRKEDLMMWKIQKMEMGSVIAELKQKVARMETQREEISTSSKVGHGKSTKQTIDDIKQPSGRLGNQPLSNKWKDLPHTIMTDSIGPLDEICFNPDDPMITSIYIHPSNSQSALKTTGTHQPNEDLHKKSIDIEHSSASSNGFSVDRSVLTNKDSQDDSDVDAMS